MKLLADKIGRGGDDPSPPLPDEHAQRRIAAARACRLWREIDPDELVLRDGGYLVHADSDAAFRRYLGDAISPGGVVVADATPLAYVVDGDGVHFLERQSRPWSQIVYERERRARAGAR